MSEKLEKAEAAQSTRASHKKPEKPKMSKPGKPHKAKGTGSKGGKVIGYTKTGNPIYAKRNITGVKDPDQKTKKLSGKEAQRRKAESQKKEQDAAGALPKGQRKKIQNLITKLKHKKTEEVSKSKKKDCRESLNVQGSNIKKEKEARTNADAAAPVKTGGDISEAYVMEASKSKKLSKSISDFLNKFKKGR